MLKALLWDVDGTLAETERDGHRVAFNLAFEDVGVPWRWDVARYGDLLRVAGGFERLMRDMADRPGAPAAPTEREALARRLHARKNEHYAQIVAGGAMSARPGVLRLIREAAAAGLPQAIATTTSRANVLALLPALLGAGWQTIFSTVVAAEDAPCKKPDPQVYQRALAQLGISADEAVAVEDSAMGVAAAGAAGLPVIIARSVYFAGDDSEGSMWCGTDLDTPPPNGPIDLALLTRLLEQRRDAIR